MTKSITILIVDDDEEDRMLTADALEECGLAGDLRVVEDGQEALDYLRREGRYGDPTSSPRPNLVLLDLNMPRLDGRAVLDAIKKDPALRRIPVIVFTTSRDEVEVMSTYDRGANSYVTKPVTFAALVQTMKDLGRYWGDVVELPQEKV